MRILIASWCILYLMVLNEAQQRELTHEDLGQALIALAKDIRENSARLERHELRERQLGEHLKKSLAALDKRLKSQDSELDFLKSALNSVQTTLQQRDERERIQLARTQEGIDAIRNSVQGQGSIELELRVIRERVEQQMTSGGGNEDLRLTSEKLREAASNLVTGEARWREQGEQAQKLATELKSAIENIKNIPVKETSNDAIEEDQPHLGAILDSLEATQRILTDTAASLERDLRSVNQIGSENVTLHAMQALREDLLRLSETSVNRLSSEIDSGRQEQSAIKSVLSEIRENGVENLDAIKGVEKVILQTADGVLDTKRRVEYGVQQIIFENNEVVKSEGKNMQETLIEKYDTLAETILLNQTESLKNLSLKMESEISQVWRQIGIMYRELSQSAGTLDRLSSQTESYVNGSLTTMDDMSGKVGQLSSRMGEVDDNLNYLLGRLSLVTQEFNMIKSGLGEALDQARHDFVALQESMNPSSVDTKRPIRGPIDDNQVLSGDAYTRE